MNIRKILNSSAIGTGLPQFLFQLMNIRLLEHQFWIPPKDKFDNEHDVNL